MDECYEKARNILEENMEVLHNCAALLLEKERITREEFEALFTEKNQVYCPIKNTECQVYFLSDRFGKKCYNVVTGKEIPEDVVTETA